MVSEKILRKIGEIVRLRAVDILSVEAFDGGILSNSINVEVDVKDGSVSIGTNLSYAPFVEYGSGLRGSENFKSYFDEAKPAYTIPIVAKNAKVLHWVDKQGKDVFVKSTKGMKPVAFLRRSLFEAKEDILKAIKKDIEDNPSEWFDDYN